MVRITEKGFQGSENNTVKGPVEEASLANANGDARSGRGGAASSLQKGSWFTKL